MQTIINVVCWIVFTVMLILVVMFIYRESSRTAPSQQMPRKTPLNVEPPQENPIAPPPNSRSLTVFSAKWCGACQHAKPIVNKIELSGVKVIRIDADEQPQLLRKNNVKSLPTFIAVKDGKTLRTQDVNAVLEFLK